MGSTEVPIDDAFLVRAQQRRESAWSRVVARSRGDEDDPDDVASTAAERVALVDTLMLLLLRNETPDGIEPRLQRSVARVLKRRR